MVTSNVYINDVVIEMTRRCNMTCDHCLRGPMQKKDQTKENIDKFFSHVDGIGSITFTGGEPSLVPDLIEYARQSAERNGVEIGNFYIVTTEVGLLFKNFLHLLWCFISPNIPSLKSLSSK